MTLTLLIDMDGPLAHFDQRFYERCLEAGYEMHSTLETQCHRFATDCIIDPGHRRAARAMVDTEPWFRDLPPVPGALAGINELLAHPDVDDVFICTKPLSVNKTCHSDKAAWVERHLGAEWLERLIITPDKSQVRGEILLDDAPKPHWFTRAEWLPVIYPMPWNGPDSLYSSKHRLDDLPRWDWTMPVNDLVWLAAEHRSAR